MNEPLNYQTPQSLPRFSALSVVALVISVLGCPNLRLIARTRPFWGGHPLERIGYIINIIVDSIPLLLIPVLGLAIGVIAYVSVKFSDNQRRGRWMAGLSIAFVASLATAFAPRVFGNSGSTYRFKS